jgi:uncharacterized membrane protein (DUF4010 family)
MEALPLGVLVALIGGLAVGVERQWSGHATGPDAHFAGLRTFTLIGGIGGIAGWMWTQQLQGPSVVLLAAAGGLIVAAYASSSRRDIDATTEVAAVVVLGAGLLAGLGYLALSSGVVAVTALVLVEKSRLHAAVHRLDDAELRAAARFAVMAVVILPLLPAGPFGPYGSVRPRDVWLLVLFFSGLSFAGYVARRATGAHQGYPLAGFIGGLVSSTSVTLTFARQSREAPGLAGPLARGVIAACTVMYVRVGVATAVLNPSLLWPLLPYLGLPCLVGVLTLRPGARRGAQETPSLEPMTNPLQLHAALQMAVIFQGVLFLVEATRRFWGEAGIVPTGALLGLTDLDALTISMARGAATGIPEEVAARAIATGMLANTALKIGVVLAVGRAGFRAPAALSLGAMIVVIGAALLWL